ncbi:MAG: hypothetical protein ACTSVI_14950 [Promethearchaeota archaeon]
MLVKNLDRKKYPAQRTKPTLIISLNVKDLSLLPRRAILDK